MRDEKWESNWIGGGILLSGVFFDLTQFNFHGLLFSQKKEDHPHHQDQNHYKSEYNYVSKKVHHVKTSASGSRHKGSSQNPVGRASVPAKRGHPGSRLRRAIRDPDEDNPVTVWSLVFITACCRLHAASWTLALSHCIR
jgi:hypothetical protein